VSTLNIYIASCFKKWESTFLLSGFFKKKTRRQVHASHNEANACFVR
jgi:hypothetical protein